MTSVHPQENRAAAAVLYANFELQRNPCILASALMHAQAACALQISSKKHLSGRSSHSAENLRQVTCSPPGRLLAIDLGAKRVGVAVSDELHITVSTLAHIERRSWKDLLRRVSGIIESYDARGLIIGLPLNLDGTKGPAAEEALRLAENFRKSLN